MLELNLLAAPAALWQWLRRPLVLLAIWAFARMSCVNLLTYPGLNRWFLNPLASQLLFVLGLLIGLRLKDGGRLVPAHSVLVGLALGYVLLALLWVKVPAVREAANIGMVWLAQLGAPRLITHFDKGHLELPRLLHILALAYVLSVWPWLRAGGQGGVPPAGGDGAAGAAGVRAGNNPCVCGARVA